MNESFDVMLIRAIEEGLSAALGSSASRAVMFYVDPHIVIKSSSDYTRRLQTMFGPGTDVIIKAVSDRICEIANLEKGKWKNLDECIRAAKEQFIVPHK